MERTIFRSYYFVGKHARFAADLVGDKTNGFFKTNISLFITSAMVGIAKNLKSTRANKKDSKNDKQETENETVKRTKIEQDALTFAQPRIWLALQLAVMNDRDSTVDVDARLRHLYESDSIPDEYKVLLEEFMLGGLEYLHEHLWAAGCSPSEKIFKMAMFAQNLQSDSDEIKALDVIRKAEVVLAS